MRLMIPRPAIEAFDAECAALLGVMETLTPDDFELATNCPPWTLHELLVHISFSLRLPDPAVPVAVATLVPGTAADYYRRPERATVEYRSGNVQQARQSAASVQPEGVITLFTDAWKQTSRICAAHHPTRRLEAGGRALTVDAYLLTRLMSVAAHGLDVAITLSQPPWTTPHALRELCPVLTDLLGQAAPSTWTDQDLLEIGAGRRPPTEADRAQLGPIAARFPLLS